MKKTLLRASAANNKRSRSTEQCFCKNNRFCNRPAPAFAGAFRLRLPHDHRQSYPTFFGVSPRRAAMLQLSSPMTAVRPASLFSMRTSKNQLSTIGKPKSLIKPNTSETSIFSHTFHHRLKDYSDTTSVVTVRRWPSTASTISPPLVLKMLFSTTTCMAASISAFLMPAFGSSILRLNFLPAAFLKTRSKSVSEVVN